MFGTSIQELFGSITVGFLAIYFSLYVLHYCETTLSLKKLKKESLYSRLSNYFDLISSQNGTITLIIFIFIYAIGQLMEDVTDNLTDSNTPKALMPKQVAQILGSEDTYRCSILMTETNKQSNSSNDTISFTPLGKYIFRHTVKLKQMMKEGAIINDTQLINKIAILDSDGVPLNSIEKASLKKIITSLYYKSKNWAYLQTNYFNELEMIQNRIDFSRSTILISILFCFFVILFASYQAFFYIYIIFLGRKKQLTIKWDYYMKSIKIKASGFYEKTYLHYYFHYC